MTSAALLEAVTVDLASQDPVAAACAHALQGLGATVNKGAGGRAAIRLTTPLGAREPGGLWSPAQVTVSVSAYGAGGPAAQGVPTWSPVGPAAATAVAAAHVAVAAVAGLRWARLRRRPVRVDVACHRALAALIGDVLVPAHVSRAGARPIMLRARDGFVGAQLPTADDRAVAGAMIGLLDPKADALRAGLVHWAATRTRAGAVAEAQQWRLPFVAVRHPGVHGDAVITPIVPTAAMGLAAVPPATGPQPLSGVRVADLGHVWAGPYAGRLLAGLGADVIKVEAPERPDGTRAGAAAMFHALNRGKRSLVADLATPAGRSAFARVLAGCDVLVENFSRRVMPALGLGPAELAAVSPGIVAVAMPGFAPSGPAADHVAYGSGLELHAGLAHWRADGTPAVASVPYLDFLSGAYAALAVVAALLGRDAGAAGAHLCVAQEHVATTLVGVIAAQDDLTPRAPAHSAAADPALRASRSFVDVGPGGARLARVPWRFAGAAEETCARGPGRGTDATALALP